MTNAHVVAGATRSGSSSATDVYDAAPVLFDPELDIRSCTSPAPRTATADLGLRSGAWRDRGGVGFPGGGGLVASAAAVAGAYPANGLDIYGEDRVTRQILELRAEVDQGDSGGPLML